MNYFELYQIPISFLPNKAVVKEKYFVLSRKYHPDFYGNGTEVEQAEALEKSSAINRAFKIFSNPDATIKYILEIKGLIVEEEKYQLPNIFLMEMMELNEALIEADQLIKNKGKQKIEHLAKEIYAEITSIIESDDIDGFSESDFLKVKEYYFKKKYLNRILESIKS